MPLPVVSHRVAEPTVFCGAWALTTDFTAGTPTAEVLAGAKRVSVRRVELFLNAGTAAYSLRMGFPATSGTPSTSVPFLAFDPADTTPLATLATAWSVAPSSPNTLRIGRCMPTAGAGIVWEFGSGELVIPANSSLVVWNVATSTATNVNVTIEE